MSIFKKYSSWMGIAVMALSLSALAACGGSDEIVVAPAEPNTSEAECLVNTDCSEGFSCQEGICVEVVAPEEPADAEEPAPEAEVDCTAEGFCEAGHACNANAECASDRCELTVGLCIEKCSAGFTFWTANGGPMGTCIPTPHPHPVEGWM